MTRRPRRTSGSEIVWIIVRGASVEEDDRLKVPTAILRSVRSVYVEPTSDGIHRTVWEDCREHTGTRANLRLGLADVECSPGWQVFLLPGGEMPSVPARGSERRGDGPAGFSAPSGCRPRRQCLQRRGNRPPDHPPLRPAAAVDRDRTSNHERATHAFLSLDDGTPLTSRWRAFRGNDRATFAERWYATWRVMADVVSG